MQKDFDTWNARKKGLQDDIQPPVLFHEREIWWCVLGVNIGSEQDGINRRFERPALILKKFNQHVLWILPLTRTWKPNPYYVSLSPDEASFAILSQIRLISSKRLLRKMSTVSNEDFAEIVKKMKKCLPKV